MIQRISIFCGDLLKKIFLVLLPFRFPFCLCSNATPTPDDDVVKISTNRFR